MGMVSGVNPFQGEFLRVFLKSSSGLYSNTLCEALFFVFITGTIELGGGDFWIITRNGLSAFKSIV